MVWWERGPWRALRAAQTTERFSGRELKLSPQPRLLKMPALEEKFEGESLVTDHTACGKAENFTRFEKHRSFGSVNVSGGGNLRGGQTDACISHDTLASPRRRFKLKLSKFKLLYLFSEKTVVPRPGDVWFSQESCLSPTIKVSRGPVDRQIIQSTQSEVAFTFVATFFLK